jgi:hypothetical protein
VNAVTPFRHEPPPLLDVLDVDPLLDVLDVDPLTTCLRDGSISPGKAALS